MTKHTYIATDAAGGKHTRKTDRVYTHTVVTLPSIEYDIERAKETKWDRERAEEHFMLANMTIEQVKAWLRAKRCDILCRDDKYSIERITQGQCFVHQHGQRPELCRQAGRRAPRERSSASRPKAAATRRGAAWAGAVVLTSPASSTTSASATAAAPLST